MQTCPKCQHVRQPHETAPDWQCPACGVAYAKAADGASSPAPVRPVIYQAQPERSYSWLKWLVLLALAYGAWAGFQAVSKRQVGTSASDLQALAATVKPGDVVMYSTTECTYCAQAKGWLAQYGFAFTECNMSVSSQCEREFRDYGGNGTPYLVMRRNGPKGHKVHHMKNGFDTDEFVALLSEQ